jgi:hypothetical protein
MNDLERVVFYYAPGEIDRVRNEGPRGVKVQMIPDAKLEPGHFRWEMLYTGGRVVAGNDSERGW